MKQGAPAIRFFNDREVRTIWDVEPDYVKAGNYWRWLKRKLKQEGVQFVSSTHGFKFKAPDGKLRVADVLNSEDVTLSTKLYPNNRSNKFFENTCERQP